MFQQLHSIDAPHHPSTSLHLDVLNGTVSDTVRGNRTLRQWLDRADTFAGFDELPMGMALEPTADPTVVTHRGQSLVNFGSNNYFASTHSDRVRQAAKNAIDRYGVGCTASRLAGGTNPLHLEVEGKLRKAFGRPSCVVFNTGYGANYAVLTVLGEEDHRIFIDEECHASLYDGARKSRGKVVRFRHNDAEHLRKRLERCGDPGGRNIVVVDGLYSMSGSVAPIAEIVALKAEVPFLLLVDEAHSFGTLGPTGLGIAEMVGCLDEVDVVTGTFSKAVGSVGGFATFSDPALELIRFAAPSYMYTAALPPPILAAISAALDGVLADGAATRARLHQNCQRLSALLNPLASPSNGMPGPVFSLAMSGVAKTVEAWRHILQHGVYLNLVLPPASPRREPMLRTGVSAAHSEAQIGMLVELLSGVIARFR